MNDSLCEPILSSVQVMWLH